jgi:hypothetical protein
MGRSFFPERYHMQINLIDLAKPKFELNKKLYRRVVSTYDNEIHSAIAFTPRRSEIVIRREWKAVGAFSNQPPREVSAIEVIYFDHDDKSGPGVPEDMLFLTPNEAFGITAK